AFGLEARVAEVREIQLVEGRRTEGRPPGEREARARAESARHTDVAGAVVAELAAVLEPCAGERRPLPPLAAQLAEHPAADAGRQGVGRVAVDPDVLVVDPGEQPQRGARLAVDLQARAVAGGGERFRPAPVEADPVIV